MLHRVSLFLFTCLFPLLCFSQEPDDILVNRFAELERELGQFLDFQASLSFPTPLSSHVFEHELPRSSEELSSYDYALVAASSEGEQLVEVLLDLPVIMVPAEELCSPGERDTIAKLIGFDQSNQSYYMLKIERAASTKSEQITYRMKRPMDFVDNWEANRRSEGCPDWAFFAECGMSCYWKSNKIVYYETGYPSNENSEIIFRTYVLSTRSRCIDSWPFCVCTSKGVAGEPNRQKIESINDWIERFGEHPFTDKGARRIRRLKKS